MALIIGFNLIFQTPAASLKDKFTDELKNINVKWMCNGKHKFIFI